MYKSRIRNAKQRGRVEKSRELEMPEDDQKFGVVEKLLGNGRALIYCENDEGRGSTMIARIRGSMRKFKTKVIVETNDLVIISPWDFDKTKGDVIHKYTYDEVTGLVYQQVLPEIIHKKIIKETGGDDFGMKDGAEDETVVFADSGTHDDKKPKANREDQNIWPDDDDDHDDEYDSSEEEDENKHREDDINIDDI